MHDSGRVTSKPEVNSRYHLGKEEIARIDHEFTDKFSIFGHWISDQSMQTYGTMMWTGDNMPSVGNTYNNPSTSAVVYPPPSSTVMTGDTAVAIQTCNIRKRAINPPFELCSTKLVVRCGLDRNAHSPTSQSSPNPLDCWNRLLVRNTLNPVLQKLPNR